MAYFNQNDYDYARKSADFAQNLNAMQSPLSGLFGAGNNIYNQQNSRAGADLANNSFIKLGAQAYGGANDAYSQSLNNIGNALSSKGRALNGAGAVANIGRDAYGFAPQTAQGRLDNSMLGSVNSYLANIINLANTKANNEWARANANAALNVLGAREKAYQDDAARAANGAQWIAGFNYRSVKDAEDAARANAQAQAQQAYMQARAAGLDRANELKSAELDAQNQNAARKAKADELKALNDFASSPQFSQLDDKQRKAITDRIAAGYSALGAEGGGIDYDDDDLEAIKQGYEIFIDDDGVKKARKDGQVYEWN